MLMFASPREKSHFFPLSTQGDPAVDKVESSSFKDVLYSGLLNTGLRLYYVLLLKVILVQSSVSEAESDVYLMSV